MLETSKPLADPILEAAAQIMYAIGVGLENGEPLRRLRRDAEREKTFCYFLIGRAAKQIDALRAAGVEIGE